MLQYPISLPKNCRGPYFTKEHLTHIQVHPHSSNNELKHNGIKASASRFVFDSFSAPSKILHHIFAAFSYKKQIFDNKNPLYGTHQLYMKYTI